MLKSKTKSQKFKQIFLYRKTETRATEPQVENDISIDLLDRITSSCMINNKEFDPFKAEMYLKTTLHELKQLRERVNRNKTELELSFLNDEKNFQTALKELAFALNKNIKAISEIDKGINEVSNKTIHLSDQLDRKNLPRQRLEEARDLVVDFYKFLSAGGLSVSTIGTQDELYLVQVAKRLRKLNKLCFELPNDDRFLIAKQRLSVASQNVEGELINRLSANFKKRNIPILKMIIEVLNDSQKRNICMDTYVHEILATMPSDLGNLEGLPKGLPQVENQVVEVFPAPDVVMHLLLESLFNSKLKDHLANKITPYSHSPDKYLKTFFAEYQNVQKMIKNLEAKLITLPDISALMKKLFRDNLFKDYLTEYQAYEKAWIANKTKNHLDVFYKELGHAKKPVQSLAPSRLNFSFNHEDRIFAEKPILLDAMQKADFGKALLQLISDNLINEHVNYGILMTLQGISYDLRGTEPMLSFMSMVEEVTSIIQLYDSWYIESIMSLLNKTDREQQECQQIYQNWRKNVESRLSQGLDRLLSVVQTHITYLLGHHQQRSDFNVPDLSGPTVACRHVCAFVNKVVLKAQENLDGVNQTRFLNGLGQRFVRAVTDHLYGYVFTLNGGMQVMQDITSYRESANRCKSRAVSHLFDILLKLVNLFVIRHENLQQVHQEYVDMHIPVDLVNTFLQLRSDMRSTSVLP
ncbi:Exocyst complex component 5 [Cichlidogyrus casuarinus]|uniref:Exocyst complex component 5 n=1 Tax=Cichlidogyrus casuarinus TaxID=1844966 RepID=A0ABD2QAH7_9PLAT